MTISPVIWRRLSDSSIIDIRVCYWSAIICVTQYCERVLFCKGIDYRLTCFENESSYGEVWIGFIWIGHCAYLCLFNPQIPHNQWYRLQVRVKHDLLLSINIFSWLFSTETELYGVVDQVVVHALIQNLLTKFNIEFAKSVPDSGAWTAAFGWGFLDCILQAGYLMWA